MRWRRAKPASTCDNQDRRRTDHPLASCLHRPSLVPRCVILRLDRVVDDDTGSADVHASIRFLRIIDCRLFYDFWHEIAVVVVVFRWVEPTRVPLASVRRPSQTVSLLTSSRPPSIISINHLHDEHELVSIDAGSVHLH